VKRHYPVIIVGGGQAGLSVSYCLKQRGIEHLVLESRRLGHSWRSERWDNFFLVTPNWQCQLPGFPYAGSDPDGFMNKAQVVEYLEAYARFVDPPLIEGASVEEVRRRGASGAFVLDTSVGELTADQVVLAVGAYHTPKIPGSARHLSPLIAQLHSSQYKNADDLPPGAVLVVGSGQSGCQIAEDLHLAGRQVHLALGDAPRSPRKYRGQDVVSWLHRMRYYDIPIESHPDPDMVRDKTNHYLTGRDGGREIDLRRFAQQGMRLYGLLESMSDSRASFAPDLGKRLDAADAVYNGIRALIDKYIRENGIEAPEEPPYTPPWVPSEEPTHLHLGAAGVTSVIWCIGYASNFGFVKLPAFDSRGYPVHERGVAGVSGLYFVGLPWLHTWGSGRFSGVARDAEHLGERIAARSAPSAGVAASPTLHAH
jgi:putative flavoprotein involved in K+ transport